MADFRRITLADSEWVRPILALSDYNSTEYSFVVLYIWSEIIHTNVARYKDLLLVRYSDRVQNQYFQKAGGKEQVLYYLFPAGSGSDEDYKEAVKQIISDAHANGAVASIACPIQSQVDFLNRYYPDGVYHLDKIVPDNLNCKINSSIPENSKTSKDLKSSCSCAPDGLNTAAKEGCNQAFKLIFSSNRDIYDYLYSAEDLMQLKGKKYQSKRNFISGFKRIQGWSYEEIAPSNIEECKTFAARWFERYGSVTDRSLKAEMHSVEVALRDFFELDLYGALIRTCGEVVAFTVGERINSDTVLVHIEKAVAEVRGAYQIINQEFLLHIKDKFPFSYVNREDDVGDAGLRKAKLAYHPLRLIEKTYVRFESCTSSSEG